MRAEAIRRAKNGLLDDDQLQQLITDRMEEDPSLWTGSGRNRTVINVQVDDGDVMLTGTVRTALDRRRAELLARALGATTVENRLRVADEHPAPKSRR
jgi:osmotically-inducible protein OsmY